MRARCWQQASTFSVLISSAWLYHQLTECEIVHIRWSNVFMVTWQLFNHYIVPHLSQINKTNLLLSIQTR